MNQDDDNSDATNLSEDQMKRILRRAIELDQLRKQRVTEQDVREIAAQLDVSNAAISQALEESRLPLAGAPEPSLLPRWTRQWRAAAAGFATGLVPGFFAGLFTDLGLPSQTGWLAILAVFGLAAIFAFRAKGHERHSKYQLRNAGLWLGFAIGIAGVVGPFPDLFTVSTLWAASTSIAGATLLWLRDAWRQRRSFLQRLKGSGGSAGKSQRSKAHDGEGTSDPIARIDLSQSLLAESRTLASP